MRFNPLDEVPSSWVIGTSFFVIYALIGSGFAILQQTQTDQSLFTAGEFFTLQNVLFALTYPLLAALLWLLSYRQRDELAQILLNVPAPSEVPQYLWLGLGMLISALGFTYLVYYPLSFINPDLVQHWLLDSPPLFYWDEQGHYWLGNLLAALSAIVFAPVVEEFVFRGYLLNRWTLNFGVIPAVILSSALFAIFHDDMLGAFVFAAFQCLLYMKTRSLIGPIIVHFVNNVIAVGIEWMDLMWWSGFTPMTMQDFYDQAGWGVFGLVIGLPWLWWYAKQNFKPLPALLVAHQNGGQTPESQAIG